MKKIVHGLMLALLTCSILSPQMNPASAAGCATGTCQLPNHPGGLPLEDQATLLNRVLCPYCLLTKTDNRDLYWQSVNLWNCFSADLFRDQQGFQYIVCKRCGHVTRQYERTLLCDAHRYLLTHCLCEGNRLIADLTSGATPQDKYYDLRRTNFKGVNVSEMYFTCNSTDLLVRYEKLIRLGVSKNETCLQELADLPCAAPDEVQQAVPKMMAHGFKLRSYVKRELESSTCYSLIMERNSPDPNYAYAVFNWMLNQQ